MDDRASWFAVAVGVEAIIALLITASTLTAPYAVASGDGLVVGAIFGVASGTAALGEAVEGVYDLKKVASQAWAAGDKIYWDNTAKNTTKTLTSNTLIGVATEAVAGGATDLIGRVRLNGAF